MTNAPRHNLNAITDIDTQRVTVMLLLESVSTLSPASPVSVPTSTTLGDAIAQINAIKAGSILITEGPSLQGILTERDVLRKVIGQRDLSEPVTVAMTAAPETLQTNDCVALLFNKMRLGGFRHLPVVDEDGRLSGMLSIRDALGFSVSLFPGCVRAEHRPLRDFYGTVTDIYGADVAEQARNGFAKLIDGPVSRLQPKSPAHVPQGTPLQAAISQMNDLKTGSLLITDGTATVGILTERDLLRKVVGQVPLDAPVETVMTRSPRTFPGDAPIQDALAMMYEGRFRHLPIADADGHVTGMLSVRDFICFMAEVFANTVARVTQRDLEYETNA